MLPTGHRPAGMNDQVEQFFSAFQQTKNRLQHSQMKHHGGYYKQTKQTNATTNKQNTTYIEFSNIGNKLEYNNNKRLQQANKRIPARTTTRKKGPFYAACAILVKKKIIKLINSSKGNEGLLIHQQSVHQDFELSLQHVVHYREESVNELASKL